MSYLQVPIEIVSEAVMEYRLVGPSETPPTPASGYIMLPDPTELPDIEGKFWVEYKIITT